MEIDKCLFDYCQLLPTFDRNQSLQQGLSEHCPALPLSLVCLTRQGQSVNNMNKVYHHFMAELISFPQTFTYEILKSPRDCDF